jgi:mannose-6-phosphate isomerase-like protein (cupin superfamily)
MTVRRVVTGHDSAGRAIFVSDSHVEPDIVPGIGLQSVKLWGADTPQSFPDTGQLPAHKDYFPPRSGYRFGIFTIPPSRPIPLSREERGAAYQRMEELLPGLASHMEPANPGMHTSDSIDFGYVLSGGIWLELDDGTERELRAGDTYIQNGTRHAWRNRGSLPCSILVVLVGTERSPSGRELALASASRP